MGGRVGGVKRKWEVGRDSRGFWLPKEEKLEENAVASSAGPAASETETKKSALALGTSTLRGEPGALQIRPRRGHGM